MFWKKFEMFDSIQTNVNNSEKILYIKLKFSTKAGTLYYPKYKPLHDSYFII